MNTWQQLQAAVKAGTVTKQQAVSIDWTGYMGRSPLAYYWTVSSPFRHTQEPTKAAWYESVGHDFAVIHFSGPGTGKTEPLKTAIEYATELTGIADWKRNRMGGYVPAIVQKMHPIPVKA